MTRIKPTDEDGNLVASVATHLGCHTQARSLDRLMERIKEAIALLAFQAAVELRRQGRPGLLQLIADLLQQDDRRLQLERIRAWMEANGLKEFYERSIAQPACFPEVDAALASVGFELTESAVALPYLGIQVRGAEVCPCCKWPAATAAARMSCTSSRGRPQPWPLMHLVHGRGYRMLQLGPGALDSAVFIGAVPPNSSEIAMLGTAFYIHTHPPHSARTATYLVTTAHTVDVIENLHWYVFANAKGGTVTAYDYGVGEGAPRPHWHRHPDTEQDVDVAVTKMELPPGSDTMATPGFLMIERREVVGVESEAVERDRQLPLLESLRKEGKLVHPDDVRFRLRRFHVGNDIAMVSLFNPYHGDDRIHPIGRFGSLAMIPWDGELIPIRDEGSGITRWMEVFLIEARSIGGMSGSPAVITSAQHLEGGMRLLGVVRGHWEMPAEEKNSTWRLGGDAVDAASRPERGVNYGIATVVPAWKLRETLDYAISQDFGSDPIYSVADSGTPRP